MMNAAYLLQALLLLVPVWWLLGGRVATARFVKRRLGLKLLATAAGREPAADSQKEVLNTDFPDELLDAIVSHLDLPALKSAQAACDSWRLSVRRVCTPAFLADRFDVPALLSMGAPVSSLLERIKVASRSQSAGWHELDAALRAGDDYLPEGVRTEMLLACSWFIKCSLLHYSVQSIAAKAVEFPLSVLPLGFVLLRTKGADPENTTKVAWMQGDAPRNCEACQSVMNDPRRGHLVLACGFVTNAILTNGSAEQQGGIAHGWSRTGCSVAIHSPTRGSMTIRMDGLPPNAMPLRRNVQVRVPFSVE